MLAAAPDKAKQKQMEKTLEGFKKGRVLSGEGKKVPVIKQLCVIKVSHQEKAFSDYKMCSSNLKPLTSLCSGCLSPKIFTEIFFHCSVKLCLNGIENICKKEAAAMLFPVSRRWRLKRLS